MCIDPCRSLSDIYLLLILYKLIKFSKTNIDSIYLNVKEFYVINSLNFHSNFNN